MPNSDIPRGFRVASSNPSGASGTLNSYRILDNHATTIAEGDIVTLQADGSITRAGTGVTAGTGLPVGVFKGVQYVGLDGLPKATNVWAANTRTQGGADAVALVHDDPTIIVEAKFTGAATNPTNADIGAGCDLVDGAGSTVTGLSVQGVGVATLGTGASNKFRFLGFVGRPDNDTAAASSAYAVGRFAFIQHSHKSATVGV